MKRINIVEKLKEIIKDNKVIVIVLTLTSILMLKNLNANEDRESFFIYFYGVVSWLVMFFTDKYLKSIEKREKKEKMMIYVSIFIILLIFSILFKVPFLKWFWSFIIFLPDAVDLAFSFISFLKT
jgi:membrane-associated HD superfamily phosphohydrolase